MVKKQEKGNEKQIVTILEKLLQLQRAGAVLSWRLYSVPEESPALAWIIIEVVFRAARSCKCRFGECQHPRGRKWAGEKIISRLSEFDSAVSAIDDSLSSDLDAALAEMDDTWTMKRMT